MTERTVQKITKVIRGTSRSESRSKKNRDSSLSPKGGNNKDEVVETKASKKAEASANTKKTAQAAPAAKEDKKSAVEKKEDKKSAVEKRKEFQTHKLPG